MVGFYFQFGKINELNGRIANPMRNDCSRNIAKSFSEHLFDGSVAFRGLIRRLGRADG